MVTCDAVSGSWQYSSTFSLYISTTLPILVYLHHTHSPVRTTPVFRLPLPQSNTMSKYAKLRGLNKKQKLGEAAGDQVSTFLEGE